MGCFTGEKCEACKKTIRWWQNGCMFSPSGDTELHYYHTKCSDKIESQERLR